MLSFTLELLQNYLPQRVSSNLDLLLNALGTRARRRHRPAPQRARRHRALADDARPLVRRAAAPAAWRCCCSGRSACCFPTAVPFGLGQVLGRVQPVLAEVLQGTPAEALDGGLGRCRRRQPSPPRRDVVGGERAVDHRPRPARALPRRLHDRRAGLAAQRPGRRRGAARRRRDDAIDRAQLRPAARVRLDHARRRSRGCWSAWPRQRC